MVDRLFCAAVLVTLSAIMAGHGLFELRAAYRATGTAAWMERASLAMIGAVLSEALLSTAIRIA
jgi:hypothetical protein